MFVLSTVQTKMSRVKCYVSCFLGIWLCNELSRIIFAIEQLCNQASVRRIGVQSGYLRHRLLGYPLHRSAPAHSNSAMTLVYLTRSWVNKYVAFGRRRSFARPGTGRGQAGASECT